MPICVRIMDKLKATVNYITPDQFNEIIAHVPNIGIRKWDVVDVQFSMKLAYACALRYGSEVVDRKEIDFDYTRKLVYLGKTKTEIAGQAVIPNYFIDECKEYWFTKPDGESILPNCSSQNLYLWLNKIGEDLGIEALTTSQEITGEKTKLHIFRKSKLKDMHYGTYGQKANIGVVQQQARHKELVSTQRYLKLSDQVVNDFWDQVDAVNKK